MTRVSCISSLLLAACGSLLAAPTAKFSVVLDAGQLTRLAPLTRVTLAESAPANAVGATFALPDGSSLQADVDPADRKTLWLQWPGTLAGKSAPLAFQAWRDAPKEDALAPDANFSFTGPNGKTAWTYRAQIEPPPPGEAPEWARSGFINPLCAPDGSILTDLRPADHLHHMGLWHAWTKAKYQGQDMDFWNVRDAKKIINQSGKVSFKAYDWRHRGKVWQGFQATQDHVAWPGKPTEVKVLDEKFTVRSWSADGLVVLDYEFVQKNVSKDPLELEVYRYGGGVGFRGRPDWGTETSDYLTSEGKSRVDAHTSRARWVAASGKTESGQAGMAMLGAPDNFDAPQHLRTWEKDHGGAIFVNFVPTQEKPLVIAPGASHAARYRIVTFQGTADKARLDAIWEDFAHPVTASLVP